MCIGESDLATRAARGCALSASRRSKDQVVINAFGKPALDLTAVDPRIRRKCSKSVRISAGLLRTALHKLSMLTYTKTS